MGRSSPQTLHLRIEAMRRAYLDRARYLGDPGLRDRCRSRGSRRRRTRKTLAATIDPNTRRAASSSARTSSRPSRRTEHDETTHFSVVDKDGNAVSNTYTLEGGFGSHVVVRGTGFILNNEMGDFNKKPGETNLDRRHRHAGEPHRARQAHAELDDARRSSRRTASCSW